MLLSVIHVNIMTYTFACILSEEYVKLCLDITWNGRGTEFVPDGGPIGPVGPRRPNGPSIDHVPRNGQPHGGPDTHPLPFRPLGPFSKLLLLLLSLRLFNIVLR